MGNVGKESVEDAMKETVEYPNPGYIPDETEETEEIKKEDTVGFKNILEEDEEEVEEIEEN